MSGKPEHDPADLPEDPFTEDEVTEITETTDTSGPIILDERESEYGGRDVHEMIGKILGIDPDQIYGVTIVAHTDYGICFGGSRGREAAKAQLVDAIVSGILET